MQNVTKKQKTIYFLRVPRFSEQPNEANNISKKHRNRKIAENTVESKKFHNFLHAKRNQWTKNHLLFTSSKIFWATQTGPPTFPRNTKTQKRHRIDTHLEEKSGSAGRRTVPELERERSNWWTRERLVYNWDLRMFCWRRFW